MADWIASLIAKIRGKKVEESKEPAPKSMQKWRGKEGNCMLCNLPNPDRKVYGKLWHKKCYRAFKKKADGQRIPLDSAINDLASKMAVEHGKNEQRGTDQEV